MKKIFFCLLLTIFITGFFTLTFLIAQEEEIDWESFDESFLENQDELLNTGSLEGSVDNLENLLSQEKNFSKIPDSVFYKIDFIAESDISFLNNNSNVKKAWFFSQGIEDLGAEIESYDGQLITTKGNESTVFSIYDENLKGAKVLPSGKLILNDSIEISSSKISSDNLGNLIFSGGRVNFSKSSNFNFTIKDGSLTGKDFFGNTYSGNFRVEQCERGTCIFGNEVLEKNLEKGYSRFSGKIILDEKSKILGDNTLYEIFSEEDSKLREYYVQKNTRFYSNGETCDDELSCIEENKDSPFLERLKREKDKDSFDLTSFLKKEKKILERQGKDPSHPDFRPLTNLLEAPYSENFTIDSYIKNKAYSKKNSLGSIRITSKNNNLIKFNSSSFIDSFEVDKINDSSKVFFNQNGVNVEFSKDTPLIKGDYDNLGTLLKTSFSDPKGNVHEIFLEKGTISLCSDCKTFSSLMQIQLKDLRTPEGREEYERIFREKYGNQVHVWYTDFLVLNGDPKVYNDVVSASQKIYEESGVYVSPEFLYTGAVAEGLDDLVKYRGGIYSEIEGFQTLGLDTFGDNAPVLRSQGYLPRDFVEDKDYTVVEKENIKGEYVHPGNFPDLEKAFVAKAAEYAWRQNIFRQDLEEMGFSEKDFSQDEIDFWTYVYYNSGQNTGKKMLKSYSDRGYLESEDYLYNKPNRYWDSSYTYANRRFVNLKAIKDTLSF